MATSPRQCCCRSGCSAPSGGEMSGNDPRLDRRAAIRILLADRGDLFVVTGLGSTSWDAASVGDDDRNFYLWGAMGAAAMTRLGVALARPDRRGLFRPRGGRGTEGGGPPPAQWGAIPPQPLGSG